MYTAKYKIPMYYQDGDNGKIMRPEFRGKTTIDLIVEGHRTGTTRDFNKKYNKYNLKIGDIILFFSNNKRVYVEVTKEPYTINSISREEWSSIECWDASVYDMLNKQYKQFQFKLLP